MAENLQNPAASTGAPPPGILVSGHFREQHGYRVWRERGTRDWLLILTLSGRGGYETNGEARTCEPGDALLLRPGVPHHYYALEDGHWELLWVHFVPEPRWMELLGPLEERSAGAGAAICIPVGQALAAKRLEGALRRLLEANRTTDYYHNRLSLNAMEEALLHLAHHAEAAARLDERIAAVLDCIGRHPGAGHSLSSLARQVALSPSRLSHLFKQQTGESVMDYVLKLRLRHGARLLEHSDMLVQSIAEEAGFGSPFHFTNQFTRLYGIGPSQYRKRVRSGSSSDDTD